MAVDCPICNKPVKPSQINSHIDSGCISFVDKEPSPPPSQPQHSGAASPQRKRSASSFFSTPAPKRLQTRERVPSSTPLVQGSLGGAAAAGKKRSFEEGPGAAREAAAATAGDGDGDGDGNGDGNGNGDGDGDGKAAKRARTQRAAAPLAERMRPHSLDEVCGQALVGPAGVLRALVETDRVPSMILWGGPGTGKTTIARCIARAVGGRFVELNATSTGVAECKRLFVEAAKERALTGRKTLVLCDELHRFSKAQQDVFLAPVEAGTVTLIGATTENPSFRVGSALLSRCRTFVLAPLAAGDVAAILARARAAELTVQQPHDDDDARCRALVDDAMLDYLARFSDGDARTALNLLELALALAARDAALTPDGLKAALTKTLVYDRAGDQHYDAISAFHKSVRGGDADAALYYLARMLQAGEDPLFVARRMVVIASEDVGLADSALLPLATAAYTAAQQMGMPEARIPLAHCAVALSLAPKSTRAYRALGAAEAALAEPGVAALPVPLHLRNAPTRLLRDMGCGAAYKYPPNYRDGRVRQSYLPEALAGRRFLEDRDLGTELDPDLAMADD